MDSILRWLTDGALGEVVARHPRATIIVVSTGVVGAAALAIVLALA